MKVCWYTRSMFSIEPKGHRIHACDDDGKRTYCGKSLNERWYLTDEQAFKPVNCKKCLKAVVQ